MGGDRQCENKVPCQKHNALSPGMARTRTVRSGDKHSNHWDHLPPTRLPHKKKTIKSLPSFNFPMMVCISLFIFWKSSLSANKRLYISLCWLLKYIQVNPGKQENSVYTTGRIKDLIEGGSTNEPSKAFPWRGTWASSPWKCLNWGH